jgi:serine/threonine protein kinase
MPSAVAQALSSAAPSPPVAVVDMLLDATIAADADFVWIEPVPMTDDLYLISVESQGTVIATASIDTLLALSVIARLAFISGVDLTSPTVVTGSARVKARGRERELVYTLRPGTELRAEVMFVKRGPRLVAGDRGQELADGDRIGHYRIIERLGAGGMGCVYKVEHVTLGRQYALKVLHRSVLERDPQSVDRFLREARAASRIQHPHIVDVFDFGFVPDGRPYFVMEMLPGASLADMIDQAPLEPVRALEIARQLGDALAAAHEHGVVHADVTPSNVLVSEIGDKTVVKLVDFGLAELREPNVTPEEPVASDFVLGTPCYVSPEQLRGMAVTEKSDQYALGVVLYEMIVGTPPFQDKNLRALCMKHIHDPVPDVQSKYGPVPSELSKFIQRCMAKSPSARYPSTRAMLGDLDVVTKLVERRGWRRWLST